MNKLKKDDGAAAIEFALVVLPLFVLIAGLIEFGIVFNANLTVTHAAHEAARLAALTTDSSTRALVAEDRAKQDAVETLDTDTDYTVTSYDCGDDKPGGAAAAPLDSYEVIVKYTVPTPMMSIIGINSIDVTGYGVEKCYE